MIQENLQKLGLTDKESQIYLSILESGKLSAQQISKITNINRTTVYSVLKELLKKGFLIEDVTASNTYYSPDSLESLKEIYKKEEKIFLEKKETVEVLLKELSIIPKSKNYSVPKVRFVDEFSLNDFMHKNLLKWFESGKGRDANWWGFQDASLLETYPEWVEYHWKVIPEYAGMKVFTNKKSSERKIASKDIDKREVRYWEGSHKFTATHVVLGDYVLFIMTNQHPHYLVETHDAVMAQNLRMMFKDIWEKSNS